MLSSLCSVANVTAEGLGVNRQHYALLPTRYAKAFGHHVSEDNGRLDALALKA